METDVSRRAVLRGAAGLALVPALGACRAGDAPGPAGAYGGPPKRGGRLRAAFIGGSTESPSPLTAPMIAIDYVRARVVWDALGDMDDAYRPRLRLAEEITSNADATVWKVRIREGVTFSGGGKLTADDVLYSLRSYVDERAPQGTTLTDIDWRNSRRLDERTVELALRAPNAFFDLALCHSMFIFPADTEDFAKALGSGPYVPVSYTPGRGSVMRRNPSYWDTDAAYLDELELVSITDAGARLNALKAGQIDYAASVSPAAARGERGNARLRTLTGGKASWVSLGIAANLTHKPFTDPRVIEALRYAVDREAMVRTVTLGLGEVANDLYGKHQQYYDASLPQRAYDPERARRLLAEAGVSGPVLRLRTGEYEYGMSEAASLLIEQTSAAGITLELDRVPASDYYSDMRKVLATPLQSLNYHARPIALDALFYHDKAALMPVNGPSSPELLRLMGRMRTATTPDKKASALRDVQRHQYERGGSVIFARMPQPSMAVTRVQGVEPRGYAGFPSFAGAWLA